MDSTTEEKTIKFKIDNIRILSSYLNSIDTLEIGEENIHDYKNIGIGRGLDLNFDKETGLMKILPQVDFAYKKGEKEIIHLFGLKAEISFKFIDFEDCITVNEEQGAMSFPDGLLLNLVQLAFSTMRGLLFNISSNTEYDHLILPLINTDDLKKQLKEKLYKKNKTQE